MSIYVDNAATTCPFPEVVETMIPFLRDGYGNPSAIYSAGRKARKALDESRDAIAELLGVRSAEITFCSGATESISTSLIGAALATSGGKKFVTSTIEHKAVLNSAKWLEEHLGWETCLISPSESGHIDPDEFISECTDNASLASLHWVNNEIGVIQPIEEIASRLKDTETVFHTDVVQGIGKMKLDIVGSGIDMLSASAHKFYGPKGCGLNYIRESSFEVAQMIVGGSQELERRAGTENVPGIIGMAKALVLMYEGMDDFHSRLVELEKVFFKTLDETDVEYQINGSSPKVAGLLNLYFPGVEAESFLLSADKAGICISAGPACAAGSMTPSYVITAMGHPKGRGRSSIRVSFGWYNTEDEAIDVANGLADIAKRISGKT